MNLIIVIHLSLRLFQKTALTLLHGFVFHRQVDRNAVEFSVLASRREVFEFGPQHVQDNFLFTEPYNPRLCEFHLGVSVSSYRFGQLATQ